MTFLITDKNIGNSMITNNGYDGRHVVYKTTLFSERH